MVQRKTTKIQPINKPIMKRHLTLLSLTAILSLVFPFVTACSKKTDPKTETKADPQTDPGKVFIETYQKAFAAKDEKTLMSLMRTDGSPAEIVDFYKSMTLDAAGQKIVSIELVKPSAEEAATFSKTMEMGEGQSYQLPITPTLQLVVMLEEKSENGTGQSTSKSPVAEVDGQLKILLPVPVKAAQ